MKLFLSRFNNKIDKKGRVSVPAQFRSALNLNEFNGVISYSSFINPCVESCSMNRIEKLSESIDNLDPYSNDKDAFATAILGGSFQLPFDGEGRIILPDELISNANLNEQALFIGKGQTFEIWNPDLFQEYFEKARNFAKEARGTLKINMKTD